MANENENTAMTTQRDDMVGALIKKSTAEWARVLPKVCTPERFARMALSCIRKNEKLQEALTTKEGKASILSSLMTCAELGIEPDGRRAHLIPYKNEITLIIDYKGLAELVMRSGLVSNIHADKVCKNDKFIVNKGKIVEHIPDYTKPRGEAYAYYANITFKDGTEKSEIMTHDEVVSISKRSKAVQYYEAKKKKGEWASETPWQTDFDEMAKKTVFRRVSKWVPLSPEVRDAIQKSDEAEFIETTAIVEPVSGSGIVESKQIETAKKATQEKAAALKEKMGINKAMTDAEVTHEVKGEKVEKPAEKPKEQGFRAYLLAEIERTGAPVTEDSIVKYLRAKKNMKMTEDLDGFGLSKPVFVESVKADIERFFQQVLDAE